MIHVSYFSQKLIMYSNWFYYIITIYTVIVHTDRCSVNIYWMNEGHENNAHLYGSFEYSGISD